MFDGYAVDLVVNVEAPYVRSMVFHDDINELVNGGW